MGLCALPVPGILVPWLTAPPRCGWDDGAAARGRVRDFSGRLGRQQPQNER